MKKGSTLVILSIIFFSHASFADSMEPASHQQISLIKQGFFEPVTVLKSAAVVQGNSRYYVGLYFLAEGYETPGIGIWVVEGNKNTPYRAYTVNATASLFSSYVSASQTQLAVSMSNPEAKKILNFLKRK